MYDFTQYAPYQGMGPGMFAAAPDPAPQQAQQQPKGGMFGGGNWLSALAAGLSGYNARVSPGVNEAIISSIQQRQQQKLQAQQQELASQRELQRQKDLYQFQLDNPKPDVPDIQQRIDALNAIKPGLGDTYAQNYAQNGGGSMIQYVDPGTGQRFAMPQPTAPTAPVGKLTPLGGPMQPASGGFPR